MHVSRKLVDTSANHGEDCDGRLDGLPRYIATVETSKHRFFTFLDQEILPDNKLIAIAMR